MAPLSELPGALAEHGTGQQPPAIRVPPPGPMSRALEARRSRVECQGSFAGSAAESGAAAPALPVVLASGRGSNLYDVDGNRYVDLAAGFGAMLLGHGAPALTHTIQGQVARLVQGLGDAVPSDIKIALLERLAALHPGVRPRVLLTGSGSDAITAALKTALLFSGRPDVLAFDGSYHGLGHGPLGACGYRASFRLPFAAQLNPHVEFAPYPGVRGASAEASIGFVESVLRRRKIGAVLVEPVVGRGGCHVPPNGWLGELCELAHRHGALVVADEIWTGLGRTGAMLRSVDVGASVDLVCLGKGLGGGLPISACIGPEPIMQAWAREPAVVHTSTHAGAPLGCAAAIATLDALRTKRLDARAREVGTRWRDTLARDLARLEPVVAVRGVGLMIGIELDSGARALAASQALLGRGYLVLTGGLSDEVLILTPALNIDEALLLGLGTALREVLAVELAAPAREDAAAGERA
jgi:4-aminobutyrate aminotransferase/(S)-3-amino-2-methylpropionate transaminase